MKKYFKYILLVIFADLIILTSYGSASADENIKVNINDNNIKFDVSPIIQNDRTLVPMRKIFEEMGFVVDWDEKNQIISGKKDSNEIIMDIGSTKAYKNDILFYLDAPPVIINSHTYVPIRFVAESIGASVKWNGPEKTINIYTYNSNNQHTLSDSTAMINTNLIQGSCVIISSDGFLLTNYHVIEGAAYLNIIFNNYDIYTGDVKIVGFDLSRDLVVLKINKSGLIPAKIGDSDKILPGDLVTAIGSPSGHMNTITNGKILGFDENIINSSAKIDHGSSGGALFNSKNELIGITSSYVEKSKYFSIPINFVKKIERNKNLSLIEMTSVKQQAIMPQNVSVYYENNTAHLKWAPIYGVDCFYIYKSNTKDGVYEKVKNPTTNTFKWYWGYPSSFGVSTQKNTTLYFKIASVKDNKVSPLSPAVEVNL